MGDSTDIPERPFPLDPARLPRHVAIIMDGNGRWAQSRGYSRIRGHQEGAESVREVVRVSGELGVPYLTLYAFSELCPRRVIRAGRNHLYGVTNRASWIGVPRGIFSKEISLAPLQPLGMTIRLEGMVAP